MGKMIATRYELKECVHNAEAVLEESEGVMTLTATVSGGCAASRWRAMRDVVYGLGGWAEEQAQREDGFYSAPAPEPEPEPAPAPAPEAFGAAPTLPRALRPPGA